MYDDDDDDEAYELLLSGEELPKLLEESLVLCITPKLDDAGEWTGNASIASVLPKNTKDDELGRSMTEIGLRLAATVWGLTVSQDFANVIDGITQEFIDSGEGTYPIANDEPEPEPVHSVKHTDGSNIVELTFNTPTKGSA